MSLANPKNEQAYGVVGLQLIGLCAPSRLMWVAWRGQCHAACGSLHSSVNLLPMTPIALKSHFICTLWHTHSHTNLEISINNNHNKRTHWYKSHTSAATFLRSSLRFKYFVWRDVWSMGLHYSRADKLSRGLLMCYHIWWLANDFFKATYVK